MRVVIADDEIHICNLLKHLIHWDELDLTLIGAFQNGIDVLSQFEKEVPDILICDIEMPGKNGLELVETVKNKYPDCRCIVISGFRNFDYVHTVMKHGVSSFLLKPIDEDELNNALRMEIQNYQDNQLKSVEMSSGSMRNAFFNAIRAEAVEDDLMAVNRRHQYRFRKGKFNIMKVCFTDVNSNEDMSYVYRVFNSALLGRLRDVCYECELTIENPVSEYILFNYEADGEKHMNMMLDRIINTALSETAGISKIRCSIGVGIPVDDITRLRSCMKSAETVSCGRYLYPNIDLFYAQAIDYNSISAEKLALTQDQKLRFQQIVERVEPQDIPAWINSVFRSFEKDILNNPSLLLKFGREVIELLIHSFDVIGSPLENKDGFRSDLQYLFDSSSRVNAFTGALTDTLTKAVSTRLGDRRNNAVQYVQQAKHYMEQHYEEEITLEKLANFLYISPVYLSTVFKNETGQNYSKYLTSVRMEKAKELLRNRTMNITQIANAVGYDSTNYFSNTFTKTVGIKPSEYRRLHQSNVEDKR